MDQTYDPSVYETDAMGYLRITGMLLIFYTVMGLHWWACFSIGIHAATTAMWYNIIIFITAVINIGIMLYIGAGVEVRRKTHEYYAEKISEEKVKAAERQARANAKAANEAKRLGK